MNNQNALDAVKLKKIFGNNLNRFLQQNGHTKKELANYMGVSTSTVSDWCNGNKYPRMDKVEKIASWFGVLKSQLTEDTTYRLVEVPYGFEFIPSTHMVPEIGTIACGTPILTEESVCGYEPCPDLTHADFCLHCKDDSMINARISDGDIVFIKKQPRVENGDIAAVEIHDGEGYGESCEATLKRFYRHENTVTLSAENPKYPPFVFVGEEINKIKIIGKAIYFLSDIK